MLFDRVIKNRSLQPIAYLIAATLSIAGCATGQTQQSEQPVAKYIDVALVYATDRNFDDTSDVEKYYGGTRGEMSYGVGTVAIKTRKAKTDYSNPDLWPPSTFETGKNAKLVQIGRMELEPFLVELSERISASDDKSALVYTHGYGRKFERAARTFAGLVYEISYQGIPVLYSWPSKGSALAYPGDVNTVDWTVPHLRDFLKLLASQNELDTIHIVVHSLGSRALLKAVMQLLDDHEFAVNWKFGEIILLAPDVDRDIFVRDIAPAILRSPSRITLYVSSVDVPLKASKSVNLYPRIGGAGVEPIVVEGIETIDASEVTNLFTGHSYYRDTPAAIEDIYYLLKEGRSADQRPTLEAVETEKGRYWKITE